MVREDSMDRYLSTATVLMCAIVMVALTARDKPLKAQQPNAVTAIDILLDPEGRWVTPGGTPLQGPRGGASANLAKNPRAIFRLFDSPSSVAEIDRSSPTNAATIAAFLPGERHEEVGQ